MRKSVSEPCGVALKRRATSRQQQVATDALLAPTANQARVERDAQARAQRLGTPTAPATPPTRLVVGLDGGGSPAASKPEGWKAKSASWRQEPRWSANRGVSALPPGAPWPPLPIVIRWARWRMPLSSHWAATRRRSNWRWATARSGSRRRRTSTSPTPRASSIGLTSVGRSTRPSAPRGLDHPTKPSAATSIARRQTCSGRGDVSATVAALHALRPPAPAEPIPVLEETLSSLTGQRRWLGNYAAWQAQGDAVGSGLIERAVTVVINWRMKGHGMRWRRHTTSAGRRVAGAHTQRRLGSGRCAVTARLLTLGF